MKKYKLLKDLPGVKAGETSSSTDGVWVGFKYGQEYWHNVLINDTDWVEEVIPEEKEFTKSEVIELFSKFSQSATFRLTQGPNPVLWIHEFLRRD